MRKFQGLRTTSLLVSFAIITFALLIQVNFAGAEDIAPTQGFDAVTLLGGQKAEVDTTQTGPFSIHTVGIVSLNNKKMKASFNVGRNQDALGFWSLLLFGSPSGHGVRDRDISIGLTSADSGHGTIVNTESTAFCFAVGTSILISPVSAADPFQYSIALEGVSR